MGLIEGLILGGGALLGGIGGAIKGAQGTPEQVQYNNNDSSSNSTSTQQTQFDPVGAQEQMLRGISLEQYLNALNLARDYDESLRSTQGYQDQARTQAMNIMGGSAFGLTPEEQAQISGLRQSTVDQGMTDINRFLDDRINQLNASAAARGVRGQALTQLQGDAVRAASERLGDVTNQANALAFQQSMSTPYQRLNAQSPFIAGGLSMADTVRQQALMNRANLQSPYLMDQLMRERMAQGKTTSTSNSTSSSRGTTTTPGREGSFWDGVAGGLGGLAGGLNAGMGIANGIGSLGGGGGSFGGSGGFGGGMGNTGFAYNPGSAVPNYYRSNMFGDIGR